MAAMCFGAVACNKDYTCRCKNHVGTKVDYDFKSTSRKRAKDDCETYNFKYDNIEGSCDLLH